MFKFTIRNLIIVIAIAFLECLVEHSFCNASEQSSGRKALITYDDAKTTRHKSKIRAISSIFNVIKYGAKGDGKTDDTKAFQAAWGDACKVQGSKMLVPSKYVFLVKPTIFFGYKCASNIIFQLDGKIIAPTSADAWASNPQAWLQFQSIKGITFQGKGILDGKGSVRWKDSSGNSPEGAPNVVVPKYWNYINSKDWQLDGRAYGPIVLIFSRCSNVIVTGITIQNSPQKHLKFYECVGVKIFRMNVSSPGDSPNTDGINLSSTQDVVIHNVNLACGDDCISILGGCSRIEIYNVNCGPGHGISIGGLGRGKSEDFVSNITVRDSIIKNAMNGVRIKTFQGGSGLVKHINFSNIQVFEVKTPIIIDQYYCDGRKCQNQTSAVAISDITYESIRGTYISRPVYFACSDSTPCKGITLSGIKLKSASAHPKSNIPFCWKAFGKVFGYNTPPITCLKTERQGPLFTKQLRYLSKVPTLEGAQNFINMRVI